MLERAVAPILAALIVGFASFYSGSDWFGQLKSWFEPVPRVIPAVRPGPVGAPIVVTPMRPLGTDSSVSSVPLPLILVRTQPGRNSKEGFAQIGVNALTPQTYTAGALLANGARLTEIYPHYVVLERDGKSVRLYLKGETPEAPPTEEAVVSMLTVGGTPTPVLSQETKTQEQLTDYVRPSPAFTADKLSGVALYPGQHRSLAFSHLGLEPGDVITQIDGHSVTDFGQAVTSLSSLLKGAALTVQVERQGASRTLALDGSALTSTPPDEPMPGIDPMRLRSSTLHASADRPIDR